MEKLNGEATILLPNLLVNCTYDVDGRLMQVVPLKGQGIFRGNISKLITYQAVTSSKKTDGEEDEKYF